MTVLFSDIKNFSGFTAEMAPDHVQRLLNEYFEAMIDIVFEEGGTIDKFIGDGLMVFFGDPEDQSDHAVRAVRASIAMQQRVGEMKREWEGRGDLPIQIRIGINTCEVMVGNMGSARRMEYTVLGPGVNLAQRLESNAPVSGILVSASTAYHIRHVYSTRPLGPIEVKGFDKPVAVHEVEVPAS